MKDKLWRVARINHCYPWRVCIPLWWALNSLQSNCDTTGLDVNIICVKLSYQFEKETSKVLNNIITIFISFTYIILYFVFWIYLIEQTFISLLIIKSTFNLFNARIRLGCARPIDCDNKWIIDYDCIVLHPTRKYFIHNEIPLLLVKGCKIFDTEQGGFLIVPHLLWTGNLVSVVSSKGPS